MLTGRIWRVEAIIRLLVAVASCAFLGSLAVTLLRYDAEAGKAAPLGFYAIAGSAAVSFAGVLACVARPWRLDGVRLRVAVLLVCTYAGLFLASLAQHRAGGAIEEQTVQGMVVSALCFQGAALPLLWLFARQHEVTLTAAFGLDRQGWHAALAGVVAGLCFVPVGLGLQYGILTLARVFDIHLPTQDAVLILSLADSWTDRLALGVIAIVLAPLAEEGLFRGVFYTALKGFGFPQAALWVTSFLFAAIHANMLIFLPLVFLSVLLVRLYERTGNLLACIACHATFNAFNFAMLFYKFDPIPSGQP